MGVLLRSPISETPKLTPNLGAFRAGLVLGVGHELRQAGRSCDLGHQRLGCSALGLTVLFVVKGFGLRFRRHSK